MGEGRSGASGCPVSSGAPWFSSSLESRQSGAAAAPPLPHRAHIGSGARRTWGAGNAEKGSPILVEPMQPECKHLQMYKESP